MFVRKNTIPDKMLLKILSIWCGNLLKSLLQSGLFYASLFKLGLFSFYNHILHTHEHVIYDIIGKTWD